MICNSDRTSLLNVCIFLFFYFELKFDPDLILTKQRNSLCSSLFVI